MEIEKNKIIIYLSGAITVIIISLYVFLYAPALNGLKLKRKECKAIENQLLETRDNLVYLKKLEVKKILITEKEIPLAIAELINYGKLIGINYISITSRPIIDKGDPKYRVLSLEFNIESEYEEIIRFINVFGKLQSSLVTLGNFSIVPGADQGVRVNLVINMYISKSI